MDIFWFSIHKFPVFIQFLTFISILLFFMSLLPKCISCKAKTVAISDFHFAIKWLKEATIIVLQYILKYVKYVKYAISQKHLLFSLFCILFLWRKSFVAE